MCTADAGGMQKCAICGGSSPLTSNQSVEDPDSSLVNEPSETTNNYDSDLESEAASQKERTSSSNESSSLSSSSCHDCSGSNYPDTNRGAKDEDRDSGPPDLAKGKGTRGETQYGWGSNGKIDVIDKFHEKYFQRVKKRELSSSFSRRKDWKAIVNDIKNSNEEATMYLHLAKLLTRVCIDACKTQSDGRCLAAYITSRNEPGTEAYKDPVSPPELVLKWSTIEEAKEMASKGTVSKTGPVRIYWHEVVSFWTVKFNNAGLQKASSQAVQYAHILPKSLPNLAGILYATCSKEKIYFFWSDNSGIVRSNSSPLTHDDTCAALLHQYISTLVNLLAALELSTRDPTMKAIAPSGENLKATWRIEINGEPYDCRLLVATSNHSRQTCVFETVDGNQIVKDHWRDDDRRFPVNENSILEKVKGVPGVVQVACSEDVKVEIKGKKRTQKRKLRTSALHSGRKPRYHRTVPAPRRTKTRCLLNSKGEPLSSRKSVLEILQAIFDSVTGHQLCFNERNVLHRDVSRYNILIRPKHHQVKFDEEIAKKAKFIKQILDPNFTEIEEQGILIDFDCAADLDDSAGIDSLRCNVGTPMFISMPVSMGDYYLVQSGGFAARVPKFPELEGRAKQLYVKAFSQEHHDRYIDVFNSSPAWRTFKVEAPFKHECWHDCESFLWVLVYELVTAWPKGEKKEFTESASEIMDSIEGHANFSTLETRLYIFDLKEETWRKTLHPRLGLLAPIIKQMFWYFKQEWSAWPELPKDHGHEVLKRLLLNAIVELIDKNDPIPLRHRMRQQKVSQKRSKKTAQSQFFESFAPNLKRRRQDESERPAKKAREATPSSTSSSCQTETSSGSSFW